MIPNLRRLYSVSSRSATRDARGELEADYDHKFDVWGEEPRDGNSSLVRDVAGRSSEETLRLRTRFTEGIEPGDQLSSGQLVLYVRSAADVDGKRCWLQITAARTPAKGDW